MWQAHKLHDIVQIHNYAFTHTAHPVTAYCRPQSLHMYVTPAQARPIMLRIHLVRILCPQTIFSASAIFAEAG